MQLGILAMLQDIEIGRTLQPMDCSVSMHPSKGGLNSVDTTCMLGAGDIDILILIYEVA